MPGKKYRSFLEALRHHDILTFLREDQSLLKELDIKEFIRSYDHSAIGGHAYSAELNMILIRLMMNEDWSLLYKLVHHIMDKGYVKLPYVFSENYRKNVDNSLPGGMYKVFMNIISGYRGPATIKTKSIIDVLKYYIDINDSRYITQLLDQVRHALCIKRCDKLIFYAVGHGSFDCVCALMVYFRNSCDIQVSFNLDYVVKAVLKYQSIGVYEDVDTLTRDIVCIQQEEYMKKVLQIINTLVRGDITMELLKEIIYTTKKNMY